jgi:hypothetical protein
MHDTPYRMFLLELPGFGIERIVQLVPFHRWTNVRQLFSEMYVPTAMQLVALTQETPLRIDEVAPGGFGLGTIDQLPPFQRSIKVLVVVLVEDEPTAKQLVVLAQDTPFNVATMFAGSMTGLGWVDHAVPFQRSKSGLIAAPPKTSPTAKQLVVDGHDTPSNSLREAPVGGAVIDHAVPFQRSASVAVVESVNAAGWYEPTARQVVAFEQETLPRFGRAEFAGLGVATIDQLVPFHAADIVTKSDPYSGSVDVMPTARQLVESEQETSCSSARMEPAGFGLATTDQLVPSQRSTKVRVLPEAALVCAPTAKQVAVVTHDTPLRWARSDPTGRGPAMIDQLVPFHRSTSASSDEPASYPPTAKQLLALAQEMLTRYGEVAPDGFGLVTIDHPDPFHRSTSVLRVELASYQPTAKQLVVLAQETPSRKALPPTGLGLDTIDHAVPFHRCTWVVAVGPNERPTAKQLVALTQDTSAKTVSIAPAGFGLGRTDHAVPFHRCTSDLVSDMES